jgi:hypothetical protein
MRRMTDKAPGHGELHPPGWQQPVARTRHVYRHALSPRQQSALVSWLAFTGIFGAVRGITYAIKHEVPPFHNVTAGTVHLHHYIWGIGLLTAVGGVAVYGDDVHRRHPAVGASYGGGLALVVDELALLLELRDVYWQRQGRWSVDAGVWVIGTAGSYFVAMPFWHHLFRRHPAPSAGQR